MKAFFVTKVLSMLVCTMAITAIVTGQTVTLNVADKTIASPVAPPAAAVTVPVRFIIQNCHPLRVLNVRVTDMNAGSALSGIDYVLGATAYTRGDLFGSVSVSINYPTPLSSDDKTINLRFELILVDTVIYGVDEITIRGTAAMSTPPQKSAFSFPDTVHVQFNLLTAGSLDFFGGSQFSNYMGELELKMPQLVRLRFLGLKDVPFGIFTGIFNYNYFSADTTGMIEHIRLQKVNPNDSLFVGRQYLSNKTRIKSKTSNKVWGYYIQPNFRFGGISQANPNLGLYLTIHAEAFSSYIVTKFTESDQKIDTLILTQEDSVVRYGQIMRLPGRLLEEITRQRIDGYFGVGLTGYVNFPDKFDFCGQAIVGKTTLTAGPQTSPFEGAMNQSRDNDEWGSFYLVKAKVTEKYTKLHGTIGVEIRGLFPKDQPSIAAYLGFRLELETFLKK